MFHMGTSDFLGWLKCSKMLLQWLYNSIKLSKPIKLYIYIKFYDMLIVPPQSCLRKMGVREKGRIAPEPLRASPGNTDGPLSSVEPQSWVLGTSHRVSTGMAARAVPSLSCGSQHPARASVSVTHIAEMSPSLLLTATLNPLLSCPLSHSHVSPVLHCSRSWFQDGCAYFLVYTLLGLVMAELKIVKI